MTATHGHAGTAQLAFRRRRLVLGIALALAVTIPLGVSLASADPSLQDQIDSAKTNAGQLSDKVDTQTSRIASRMSW